MTKEQGKTKFFGFFDMRHGQSLPQSPKPRGVFVYPNSETFLKFMEARQFCVGGLLFKNAAEIDKHHADYELYKTKVI